MTTALLYGLATAIPLVIGAAIGMRWNVPPAILGALMAFGAGTMISAVSEELFAPAFEELGALEAGVALMIGALVYVVGNHWLEARYGLAAAGIGLMFGTLLDGIPENLALGVTLAEGGTLVLLIAIIVGNTPEAIASAAAATAVTRSDDNAMTARRHVLLPWVLTALALVAVTVVAFQSGESISARHIAVVQAFAGGATIAVLASTLMPEAYREGGWWVGIATALGFLAAFSLGG